MRLLYANHKDIRLFNWTPQGKSTAENERVIVTTVEGAAVAIDFLYADQYIFWIDVSEQTIFGCSLKNVCKPEIIVSDDVSRPEGLAVDWLTRKLYWTDYDLKQVSVSSINGKYRKILISRNVDNPRAIAVDPKAG